MRLRFSWLTLAWLLWLVFPAAGAEPEPGTIRYERKTIIEANGNGRESTVIDFAIRDYEKVKKDAVQARRLVTRFPVADDSCLVSDDSSYAFDDSRTAVVFERHLVGAVRPTAGGDCELPVPGKVEFIADKEEGGRPTFFFTTNGEAVQLQYQGKVLVVLPAGSTNAMWDPKTAVVRYTPASPGSAGGGRIRTDLEVRDPLMTSIYKVYSQPINFPDCWVARAALRNIGDGPVRNLRVRFRIDGHSEWSDWQAAAMVAPGQTMVVPWHPVLDRKLAELRASAPTRVIVEWSIGGGAAESVVKPLQLLGGHEFQGCGVTAAESYGTFSEMWNRIPFIAAWVSRDDAVVKEFAGMASRNARGAAANMGDEAALKLIKSCYELMVLNDFAYKAPPGILDPTIKFDVRFVQNIKFPRDVIRDKSGTCIDLAILLCSMYQTLGLRPYMALVPGHAFPVALLESGDLVPVESTGIRGGVLPADSLSFQEAHQYGERTLKEHHEKGTLILVDMWKEWARGIANPELEILPADILQKWGIKERGEFGGLIPDMASDKDLSGFSGAWTGDILMIEGEKATSRPSTLRIQLAEEGRFRLFLTFDSEIGGTKVPIEEEGVAENQDGQLVFQGLRRNPAGEASGVPGRGTARIVEGRLAGKYGDDDKGFKSFTLEKKK